MRLIRRDVVLVLILTLTLSAALAEPVIGAEPPFYQALLDQVGADSTYALTIKAGVKAWPDLSAESLGLMQDWLSGAELNVSAHPGSGMSELILNQGDAPVLSVFTQSGETNRLLISTGNGATSAYVSRETRPWESLLGIDPALPRLSPAKNALTRFAQTALPVLLPYEKPVKTSITIKNVGRGAGQLVYTLKKADAQTAWEAAKTALLPLMEQFVNALLPGQTAALMDSLSKMEMNGTLTLKRFLDKDGKDLGLQLTATVLLDRQSHKLTLFYGLSDTGLYLSVKLPATRGRDTLEIQVSLAAKPERLTGDWRYKLVIGKNTETLTGELDLKAAPEENGARVSGELTALFKTAGEEKTSRAYTLSPDVLVSGSSVNGGLALSLKNGNALTHDLIFSLSGKPLQQLTPPLVMAEVDLDRANAAETEQAAQQIRRALLPPLQSFLLALPLDARLLVLHDLGRDQRTDGENVSVLSAADPSFTVEEPTTAPDSKEDTP